MNKVGEPWGNYLLKDIVETSAPKAIEYWPQTVGWAVLALILFLVIARKLFTYWETYKRNAYRREAIAWLQALPPFENINTTPQYRQLPALIRTAALHAFGSQEVTLLTRDKWEEWLDQQCQHTEFSNTYRTYLYQLAYSRDPSFTANQMNEFVKQISTWIKSHQQGSGVVS